MILINDLDVNHHALLKAKIEEVGTLPTGLGGDDAGRVVFMNGLFIWNGYRWLGFSDNKYLFKPNNQLITLDDTWYDDAHIEFEIGAYELYQFKFFMLLNYTWVAHNIDYSFKFVSSESLSEMTGTMMLTEAYPSANGWEKDMLTAIDLTLLTPSDQWHFIYDGIIYGGSVASTVKLQHKAVADTGIVTINKFSRLILQRIY